MIFAYSTVVFIDTFPVCTCLVHGNMRKTGSNLEHIECYAAVSTKMAHSSNGGVFTLSSIQIFFIFLNYIHFLFLYFYLLWKVLFSIYWWFYSNKKLQIEAKFKRNIIENKNFNKKDHFSLSVSKNYRVLKKLFGS